MAVSGEEWAGVVSRYFGFLDEYGFGLDASLGSGAWYRTRVVYAAEVRAVAVDKSVEYQRVEVTLARLIDGKLPPGRVFVTADRFDEVLLDNVVEARVPEHPRWGTVPGGTWEEQLSFWAQTLRTVAPDFLQGELTAIADGERAVRARMTAPARARRTQERERLINRLVERARQKREDP